VTGQAIHGAAACASHLRNGTRVRRLYTVGEGSPAALVGDARACRRFDRCFLSSAAAITAGPLLAISTVAPPPAAD
jgi:hypothetical protein